MQLVPFWFIVIAVLWTGYFLLEGFDFGVGVLLPVLGRDETRRRVLLNTIGPVWDGNEVWLIAGGGTLFLAFPTAYASAFSGLVRMGLLALQTELGQEAARKKGKDADEARQALTVLKTVVNRTDGSTLLVSASVPQTTVAAMVRKQMTKHSTATTGKTTRRTPRRRTTRRH